MDLKIRYQSVVIVSFLSLCLALPACSTNPATGKRQFNVLSRDREIALGAQAGPEFLKEYGGEIPSLQIRTYVSDLGHRLAAVSERPNLPWEFFVVDSGVINAFALPGGKVYISRALLVKMNNEAQLAAVLGHEIGHVTAEHIGQQMSQGLVVQGIGAGLGVAAGASDNDYLRALGIGAQAGGTLYLLRFGRTQENQADELGMRYMTRLGYNPVGALEVMEILKDASGGGGQIEFLSTHPLPQTRIDRVDRLIRERYPNHDQPDRYRFGFDEFEENIARPLGKLPPPRHAPKGS